MSLSQPKPPDPYTSSAIQQQFAGQNLVNNALINDVQQQTPYGSMGYNYTETPSGIPEITATQTLGPAQQGLLNTYQGTQQNLANTGNNLSNAIGTSGIYGSLPSFAAMSSPLVQSQMNNYLGYMQPFYNIQNSNLTSMLQNQGIPQGSQAWNNAEMGLDTSQNQGAQSALMNFEPQAFAQAIQNYQMPLQTASGLMSAGTPASLNASFYQQPMTGGSSGSVAPNYQQAAQAQYQAQQNQFQNTTSGLEQLGSGLLGFSGGGFGGIGAGIRGLFGGLGGAGQLTSNDSRIFD